MTLYVKIHLAKIEFNEWKSIKKIINNATLNGRCHECTNKKCIELYQLNFDQRMNFSRIANPTIKLRIDATNARIKNVLSSIN
mgnify:CR=1 FL=1